MDKNSAKRKKLTNSNDEMTKENFHAVDENEGKEKIQRVLILNAWRHQKEKNKKLELDVKTLSTQVDSLQLQIYVLKHLLDAEKTRVVHFNSDLQKILTTLEECKHEKHSLLKEKEQLEFRLRVMEEKLAGLEMECKNQKNELITVRSEAQNWEKQLEKEREKLAKMKDERKFFIEENIQETEEPKETTNSSNSRKSSRESRVKSTSCKSGKKNSGRGREDRGVGKVDFGKNDLSFSDAQNGLSELLTNMKDSLMKENEEKMKETFLELPRFEHKQSFSLDRMFSNSPFVNYPSKNINI